MPDIEKFELDQEFAPFSEVPKQWKDPNKKTPEPLEASYLLLPPPMPDLLLITKIFYSSEAASTPNKWRVWVEADKDHLSGLGSPGNLPRIKELMLFLTLPDGLHIGNVDPRFFRVDRLIFAYFNHVGNPTGGLIPTIDPTNHEGILSIRQRFVFS